MWLDRDLTVMVMRSWLDCTHTLQYNVSLYSMYVSQARDTDLCCNMQTKIDMARQSCLKTGGKGANRSEVRHDR